MELKPLGCFSIYNGFYLYYDMIMKKAVQILAFIIVLILLTIATYFLAHQTCSAKASFVHFGLQSCK